MEYRENPGDCMALPVLRPASWPVSNRINILKRVAFDILIRVGAAPQSNRVALDVPGERSRVVAETVVVVAGLGVELLPRQTQALRAERAAHATDAVSPNGR